MNIDLIPHLGDCIDMDSPYAKKYIELISTTDVGDDLEGHHIVPAAFYKYVLGCEKIRLVSSLDMVPENIVQLTKIHHILAHYYLARCIKHPNNVFTDSQLYAFVNMFSKRIMKKHPLFDEMAVFADENKGVKRRYKQYELCPPTIPSDCSFYQDAIIHTDRTGAWVTQIRDHGKEHYTYDHFGNCLDIQIEGQPSIWVVRSLTNGRVLSIATDADEQSTYAGFSENGDCYLCYDWQGRIQSNFPYRVSKRTYRFADAMYRMSNYISHILSEREFASFMTIVRQYIGKCPMGILEPYPYYSIPKAPKRIYSQAHCDEMVKQCENSAELWMSLYNDGTRPDGAEAANYFKKLADVWRKMTPETMPNRAKTCEHNSPVSIVVEEPTVCAETPVANSESIIQCHPVRQKMGFWQRVLHLLTKPI